MKELKIPLIKNGTVIDHITAGNAIKVLKILEIPQHVSSTVSVAINVRSHRGKKDIVKPASRALVRGFEPSPFQVPVWKRSVFMLGSDVQGIGVKKHLFGPGPIRLAKTGYRPVVVGGIEHIETIDPVFGDAGKIDKIKVHPFCKRNQGRLSNQGPF